MSPDLRCYGIPDAQFHNVPRNGPLRNGKPICQILGRYRSVHSQNTNDPVTAILVAQDLTPSQNLSNSE